MFQFSLSSIMQLLSTNGCPPYNTDGMAVQLLLIILIHTHTHIRLMAILPDEPWLASCPLTLLICSGHVQPFGMHQKKTFHTL